MAFTAPSSAVSGSVTAYSLEYVLADAGTANGAISINILTDLAAAGFSATNSPLYALLDDAFADATAALTAFRPKCDLQVYAQAMSAPGTTAYFAPTVSGSDAGNFRISAGILKAAGTDTATYILRIVYRQSLTA